MGERDRHRTRRLCRSKVGRRHHRIHFPARQLHLMALSQRVATVHRAQHPRQLVVGTDPDLHEDLVVGECHHVGTRPADDLRLTDVEGADQTGGETAVGVGEQDVGEREIDACVPERRLERLVDRWRCGGDGNEVFRRRMGGHRPAVIVERGGRTIAEGDHAQFVGSLHEHFGDGHESQRRAEAARMLVGDLRREGQRACRCQTVAHRLQQIEGACFEHRLVGHRRSLPARGCRRLGRLGGVAAARRLGRLRLPAGEQEGRGDEHCCPPRQLITVDHRLPPPKKTPLILITGRPLMATARKRQWPARHQPRRQSITESFRIRTSCWRSAPPRD